MAVGAFQIAVTIEFDAKTGFIKHSFMNTTIHRNRLIEQNRVKLRTHR